MPSLNYEDIYSAFRTKANAYDLLSLQDSDVNMFMCDWMKASFRKPYVRRLFDSISFDDITQSFTYEMKYEVDEESDKDFIIEAMGIGMVIEWITPKINNLNNIMQVFGSSEEKFYSQSSHLSTLKDLRHSLIKEQRDIIRDRGYIWNSYLNGE